MLAETLWKLSEKEAALAAHHGQLRPIYEALGLSREDVIALAGNSFEAAFVDVEQRQAWKQQLRRAAAL